MSLPKLNEAPKYSATIPSTGQKIRFRPFIVKEEKILMMAIESKNQIDALDSITETIEMCITEDIDRDSLKIFDVEYLFTKIRSKSIGESVPLIIECSSCKHKNPISVDISNIEVDVPKVDNIIKLNSDVSIEVRWPNYQEVIKNEHISNSESDVSFVIEIVANSIVAIITDDERILTKDETKESIIEFVESMNTDQFSKIQNYLEKMPKIKKDIEFECTECKTQNKLSLENINDFF